MDTWALPVINRQRCSLCGDCIEKCTANVLVMASQGPVFARPEDCTYCADCEAICPEGAIRCALEIVWGRN